MKINAMYATCGELSHSGMTEGEHMMLDNCWNCAPFWWIVPICPTHKRKLNASSGYCKECKQFYQLSVNDK